MSDLRIDISLSQGAQAPHYGSEEAAGADLRAYLSESMILQPGESKLIPTGVKVALPKGYEMQIRPRSGLAFKSGITVLNTPGTIDSDYRGEVGVILINHGKEAFEVTPGMRIAQAVVAPVVKVSFVSTDDLATTVRGEGGFGHTGTH